jgi:subfamily B ATP-binding cassette protein MsbA
MSRMETGKDSKLTTKDIYKRLFPYIRPYRMRLVIGIFCGLLYGGATVGQIVVLKWALGGLVGEGINIEMLSSLTEQEGTAGNIDHTRLLFIVFLLPVIALVQGIVFFVGKYMVEWVGNRVVTDLRGHLFEQMHALPMQFFSKSRVGELIARITSDTGLLNQLVSNEIGDLIREPFTLIACAGAMVYLDWRLSLIVLLVFPFCVVPVSLLGQHVRKASKVGQEYLSDMLSVVQESLGGALVVKAFQMERAEAARFNFFNKRVFKMSMRQSRARSINSPIMDFISSLGLVGVVVYAFLNDLPLSMLIAFAVAMAKMYKPAKTLSKIHMRIQKATPGAVRIFEILDTANTIADSDSAISVEGPVRSVEFKNVSFAYDEKKILNGINLSVKAGECVAFVGSSGAGKTTIVNLIPRFFDVTEGSVALNGVDLREYKVQSLRSQIGVVTQDTVLFNQSVAENISYGSPHATQKDIETAARRANAHEFIMELDAGYDTVVGERGSLLSGGMAQRLAIARALLKNPPILTLDEATSALDTESERLVQGALDELMKDRTVFVIAHRLSTIAHADSIVVLEQGKIVEKGSHVELLEKGGKYRYFHDIQFSNTGSSL